MHRSLHSVVVACGVAGILMPALIVGTSAQAGQHTMQLISANGHGPWAAASVINDESLVLTGLILPTTDDRPSAVRSGCDAQVHDVLQNLQRILRATGSGVAGNGTDDSPLTSVARLNLYVAEQSVAEDVRDSLQKHWPAKGHFPPLTIVVSTLPVPDALLALDAVAVVPHAATDVDKVLRQPHWARMPAGCRLFVSGQAERGDSLREATRATLAMLQRTLESLQRSHQDIVQLKAFVMPMSDLRVIQQVVDEFFAGSAAPPLIAVEWKSSLTTPIEIELIAWGGPARPDAPSVEHLWLPWMSQSPVYCRVGRVNHGGLIFTGGLTPQGTQATTRSASSVPDDRANVSKTGGRPRADQDSAADAVHSVFRQLDHVLRTTGSDFRHLVKATYYVSQEDASAQLNELRPQYYHAQHPPAASKAFVLSVGKPDTGLAVDMIAVPVQH